MTLDMMIGTSFDAENPVPRLFIYRRACTPLNSISYWLENSTHSLLQYQDQAVVYLVPCERLWTVGEENTMTERQKLVLLRDFSTKPKSYLDRLQKCWEDTETNNLNWYVTEQYFINIANVTVTSVFDFLTPDGLDRRNPLNSHMFDARYFTRLYSRWPKPELARSVNHRCLILEIGAMGVKITNLMFNLLECHPRVSSFIGDTAAILVSAGDSRLVTFKQIAFIGCKLPMIFAARNFDPNSEYTDLIDVDSIQLHRIKAWNPVPRFHIYVYDFVGHMIIDVGSKLTGLTRASGNIFRVENLARRMDIVMFLPDSIKYSTEDELQDRVKGAGIEVWEHGSPKSLMVLYIVIAFNIGCYVLDVVLLVMSAVRKPIIGNHPDQTHMRNVPSRDDYYEMLEKKHEQSSHRRHHHQHYQHHKDV